MRTAFLVVLLLAQLCLLFGGGRARIVEMSTDEVDIRFKTDVVEFYYNFNATTYPGFPIYTRGMFSAFEELSNQTSKDWVVIRAEPVTDLHASQKSWTIYNDTTESEIVVSATNFSTSLYNATIGTTGQGLVETWLVSNSTTLDITGSDNPDEPEVYPLTPSGFLIKISVSNWTFVDMRNKLQLYGNVITNTGELDISWETYPRPTRNLKTVHLFGGPKSIVITLANNATMTCDGEQKSANINLIHHAHTSETPLRATMIMQFQSFAHVFGEGVTCKETSIEYITYIELSDKTKVNWIAIVLGVAGGVILMCCLCGVVGCFWCYHRKMMKDEGVKFTRFSSCSDLEEYMDEKQDLILNGDPEPIDSEMSSVDIHSTDTPQKKADDDFSAKVRSLTGGIDDKLADIRRQPPTHSSKPDKERSIVDELVAENKSLFRDSSWH